MRNDACGCCEAAPCSAPVLEYDSISAAGAKCGYPEFIASSPPRRYRISTMTGSGTVSRNNGLAPFFCPGPPEIGEFIQESTFSFTWTQQYNADCTVLTSTYGGSASGNRSCEPPTDGQEDCECTGTFTGTGGGALPYSGGWDADLCGETTIAVPCNSIACTPTATSTTETQLDRSCSGEDGSVTDSTVLSDEFTTSEMISTVEGLLPAYDDDWNDTAGTFRNLTTNELNYSIRECKFRITHYPNGMFCHYQVWTRYKLTPAVGSPSYTDGPGYTWHGAGNPCFANRPYNHIDNKIVSAPFTMPNPEVNGTITVETKWSCVNGYEPEWGDTANYGYPPR